MKLVGADGELVGEDHTLTSAVSLYLSLNCSLGAQPYFFCLSTVTFTLHVFIHHGNGLKGFRNSEKVC